MYFLQFIDHIESKNIPNKKKISENLRWGIRITVMLFLLETNVPTTRYVYFGAGEKLKIFGRMDYTCNYVAYELNGSLCCFIVSCSRHRCDAPGMCIQFFKPGFCLRRVLVMAYVGGLRIPAALHFRVRATRLLGEVRAAVGDDGVTRRDATTSERAVRTDSS